MIEILFINHDTDNRIFFSEAAKQISPIINTHFAKTAEEGLAWLRHHPRSTPNFIFIDLNMPCMSGLNCLMELRQMHSINIVPIIIFAKSAVSKDMQQARKLGANFFFIQPEQFENFVMGFSYILG